MKRAALILTVALCACEERKPPVTLAPEQPIVSITPTPAPSPPIRHAVPRPQPTPEPEQVLKTIIEGPSINRDRWNAAKIKPSWQIAVDKAVMLYLRTKDRYEAVENMRSNGVPAPVIFCLHYRESSNSFKCHLHEGSSLLHRTRDVPKNRLPPPDDPPYEWTHSAEDAIYVCDRLQGPWDTITWSVGKIIAYNGMGYDKRGVPSPYAYSGTNIYISGKFTSDGHYSSSAIDQQLGCVAILLRMREKGIAIKFAP